MSLIICDVGGVLCDGTDVTPTMAASLGLTREAFDALSGQHAFHALLCGTLTEGAFWDHFSLGLGRTVPADLWSVFFDPRLDEKMAQLICALREASRVVAGTNTIESHYDALLRTGWYGLFDAVYASHRMGTAKPDPRFYRHILEEEGCAPSEAFFIDDEPGHVVAARAMGLQAHEYKSVPSLRRDLEKRGLIQPERP
ncbi:MAG: HAD family phosphatase [Candidatus Bipolaricaulis sp.]|nr:HAD family phosphatase [Candidatus Bipolaricaulis sp.]MDD5219352.1 HAD family phosphatase [Candidatus Bipolaricaulis sp.]MDD5645712.1 HAD family phosphatase [Candidatus Bipolaricaulis sp.]